MTHLPSPTSGSAVPSGEQPTRSITPVPAGRGATSLPGRAQATTPPQGVSPMTTAPMFAEDWIKSDGRGGVIIGTADAMPAEHLPQLIAWIYEAAGKQLITLPRCEVAASGESGPGWHVNNGGGVVVVRADRSLPPDEARTLAAVIASTADLVDRVPEPDRAKVERMAAFFNEAMDADPETLARRLLADFEVKERAA